MCKIIFSLCCTINELLVKTYRQIADKSLVIAFLLNNHCDCLLCGHEMYWWRTSTNDHNKNIEIP